MTTSFTKDLQTELKKVGDKQKIVRQSTIRLYAISG